MNRETLVGKLELLKRDTDKLIKIADSALTIIVMKADPYTDTANLDTEMIKLNAEALHEAVTEIRKTNETISKLQRELGL
jgi:uncharacterized protein YlaN (UPF0358 family)